MKSIVTGISLCLFLIVTKTFGQRQANTVKDSINIFYDQLFEKLEGNFLYKDEVNWQDIKPYVMDKALKSSSWKESLELTSVLFDTINGDHLLLFSDEQFYQSNLKRQVDAEEFHPSLIEVLEANKAFEVRIVGNNYGYVFLPGMLLLNATQEELNAKSQEIYDAIMDLNNTHNVKGWIIDLRTNIGGNSNVMLAGLYHLLGNNTVGLGLDSDKNLKNRTGLHEGVVYENHEVLTQIKTSIEPNAQVPVALITGVITNSAGEFVVMGFRGRENVIVIGEETYGSTTSNDLFEMPFGTKAAITLSYGTDRTGVFTKNIVPDISIIKEANFQDLLHDKNVIEAVKFINSRQ